MKRTASALVACKSHHPRGCLRTHLAGADARLRILGRAGDAEAARARVQRARPQLHLRAPGSPTPLHNSPTDWPLPL